MNLRKSEKEVESFQKALLAWYDRHGRDIPWRYKGGARADPYRVWLSEVMCQQTTVQAVVPYFLKFTAMWPDVKALAAAPSEEIMKHWAGLGYYARARNLHKCARMVAEEHGGAFPETPEGLKQLPGIGDYTAAAIAAMAFNVSSPVVDGNVERVMARLFAVEEPLPASKPLLKKLAAPFFGEELKRPGDLAQAFMDLGAMICIPAAPRCALCPVADQCAGRAGGIQAELPRRAEKQPKPQKTGHVYLVRDGQGRVLLERRPETAMMGGMSAFPTSPWLEKGQDVPHPDFIDLGGEDDGRKPAFIRHSFTHFDLQLTLRQGRPRGDIPSHCFWVEAEAVFEHGFPTLFKKALRLWSDELIAERPRKAV